jgi:nucleoid-associated protein YgaU
MAISRYKNTKNFNSNYQNTFPAINIIDIQSNSDIFYVIVDGDRMDTLATKFLGDGRYWWIIALLNDIKVPFGDSMKPGTIIRIPTNITNILFQV